MASITARTITDSQIRTFRAGAAAAGDLEAVAICNRALAGRGGRGLVAEWISWARAEGFDPAHPVAD